MKEQIENTLNTKFSLCGGRRCCPVVEIKGDITTIADDFGSTVKFETEQLKILFNKCKEIFNED